MATLEQNINQAISDFASIKNAIIKKGMAVPAGTPTSEYASRILAISGGEGGGETLPVDRYFEGGYAEVVLPNAESIKQYVFCNDTALVNIIMPKVKKIGNYTFASCSKLALTSLPSEITSIGAFTFQSCKNLALTSLPSGLTSIGTNAFQNCTGLTSLTFKGTPKTIASNAFNGCTNLTTINVPWAEGAVANAPWSATNATINYNYTGE